MRPRAALVGMALSLLARVASASDPDPWLGGDKALHFGVSVGLAGGGYAASALLLEHPWQRAVAGGVFSLALGGGKEVYDLSGHGDASWKDFTWDVAGTAVGLGIALLVDAALAPRGSADATSGATRMAIAF